MSSHWRRVVLPLALLALAPAAASARLLGPGDLPVRRADRDGLTEPCLRGDVLEIQLAPSAARAAFGTRAAPSRRQGVEAIDRLSVPALDRVAASLGGAWFEPEFLGEAPAPLGAGGTDFSAFYVVHLPLAADLGLALERFSSLPEIRSADPIPVLAVDAVPNDSLWNNAYWFYQPSRRDLHAPEAWDVTTGDSSIVVAIVDTGLLRSHPDLGGTVDGLPGQVWTNWAERGGLPGVDDDGNGFADDTWGWDFVALTDSALNQVRAGEDWRDSDNDPNDLAGHGTMVSGLAGGMTNNLIGVAGTSWNVRLMPLRIGWASTALPLPGGFVDMSFAAKAIRYATRMGASIINCSFSTANLSGLGAVVDSAVRSGILVVSAAGNNRSPHYLGDREDVLAVTATDGGDAIPAFANRFVGVDLAAPGFAIVSTATTSTGTDSVSRRQPFYRSGQSGTSFSAPLAAGAAALVQSRRQALGLPRLTPMQMILRLHDTADPIDDINPSFVTGYGSGRLDLQRALLDGPTSTATRGGALTVGPAVVLPGGPGGASRAAWPTSDGRLVVLEPFRGDTVRSTPLGGPAFGQLAGAFLDPGRGIGLFVGTTDSRVLGLDTLGVPLPGWPVTVTPPGDTLVAGPALGDLDGDGVVEVVCGTAGGSVWAWRLDGSVVPGFPVALGARLREPVALSDLDGNPGVEIVAAATDGQVHALTGAGLELAGWPHALAGTNPLAPVVGRLAAGCAPVVVTSSAGRLVALDAAGVTRFDLALPGNAVTELAVADLNHDGADEVLVPIVGTGGYAGSFLLLAYDTTGAWPAYWPLRYLVGLPIGPPVVGALRRGGREGVLILQSLGTVNSLAAFDDSGTVIARFPVAGQAGAFPSLADLDQDGATEVAAGTGPDSLLYLYDAEPGSWSAFQHVWPTPRGNFARTGSTLYEPPGFTVDQVRPAAVADLGGTPLTAHALRLRWTASGDDSLLGCAERNDLRLNSVPITESNFASSASVAGVPRPGPAGTLDSLDVPGLSENSQSFFAIKSRDHAGNWSLLSNVVSITLPGDPPGTVQDLSASNLAAHTLTLHWTAPGDDSLTGTAASFEVRRAPFGLGDANFSTGTLVPGAPAPGAPGSPESLAVVGLPENTTIFFGLRTRDEAGNLSHVSNLVLVTTPGAPPAAVADLVAGSLTDSSVTLRWTATGNDGTIGRPELYLIRAAPSPLDSAGFANAPLARVVTARQDAGGAERYTFTGLERARTYWFALRARDPLGNLSPISNLVTVRTPVGGPLLGRVGVALASRRSPARLPVEIYWQGAAEAVGTSQFVRFYDVSGRLLRTLPLGGEVSGVTLWDGRDGDGALVPSGLYFARLSTARFHSEARIVLLR